MATKRSSCYVQNLLETYNFSTRREIASKVQVIKAKVTLWNLQKWKKKPNFFQSIFNKRQKYKDDYGNLIVCFIWFSVGLRKVWGSYFVYGEWGRNRRKWKMCEMLKTVSQSMLWKEKRCYSLYRLLKFSVE